MLTFSGEEISKQTIEGFEHRVVSELSKEFSEFQISLEQREAWTKTAHWVFQSVESSKTNIGNARFIFEYRLPLDTIRPDLVVVADNHVLVIEIKSGEGESIGAARKQTSRYAERFDCFVDHAKDKIVFPVLMRPTAPRGVPNLTSSASEVSDRLVELNPFNLAELLDSLSFHNQFTDSDPSTWTFEPRPNIVDAARVMLSETTDRGIINALSDDEELSNLLTACEAIVSEARDQKRRIVIAITGVPGAGKTLVGLRLANSAKLHKISKEAGVIPPLYLSGNGPLVDVLTEALARDEQLRTQCSRAKAEIFAKSKIRLIHGFVQSEFPAKLNVLIFDEAQRVWTESHMRRKMMDRNLRSEAEEILNSLETSEADWAVAICLVGTGQQINSGEKGLSTWVQAIRSRSILGKEWTLYASSLDSGLGEEDLPVVIDRQDLHLKTVRRANDASMLGDWVNCLLEGDFEKCRELRARFKDFPIFVSRNLDVARAWLRESTSKKWETYGLLASSQSARLTIYGIDPKASAGIPHDWTQWFLDRPPNLNSSMMLEVAATEFKCQGLELDRVGVCWSWDLICGSGDEESWVARKIHKKTGNWRANKSGHDYAINAYRVLLTRSRLGMVIWVPEGDQVDKSRNPISMDEVFQRLILAGCDHLQDST